MSASAETAICVAYRDDGFLRQLSFLGWSLWMRGRLKEFPPVGFVGQVSTSSRVGDAPLFRLSSIRMRRLQRTHFISGVPLWRLTCEWETPRHQPRPLRSGPSSVFSGNVRADAGAVGSTPRIRTTSTNPRS